LGARKQRDGSLGDMPISAQVLYVTRASSSLALYDVTECRFQERYTGR